MSDQGLLYLLTELHGPSMFVVKAKMYGVFYNQYSSIAFDKTHVVIGPRQKAPNFSAFHWSPYGSLVSIGQRFVTTRILPKRTDTSLITETDKADRISESDEAVRAVHRCYSWFSFKIE